MPDMFTLMPLAMVIALFLGAALNSKSLLLSAGGAYPVLAYVAVRSQNNLFLGFFLLMTFFLVMGTGVFMTQTVMGETA